MTDENTLKPEETTPVVDPADAAPTNETAPVSAEAVTEAPPEHASEMAATNVAETHSEQVAEPETASSVEHADTAEQTAPSEPTATTEPKHKKQRKQKAAPAAVAAPDEVVTAAVPSDSETPTDAAAIVSAEAQPTDPAVAAAPAPEPVPESKRKWYAVKVQSGREESIKAAVERKVKIEGLEEFFGQIVIPVEEMVVKKKVKVKNKKTGETTTQEKNATKYNKKYPGYLFTEVEFNDQILYVFRETSGVGDFVGINSKRKPGATEPQAPTPLPDDEVRAMLTGDPGQRRKSGQPSKTLVKLDFEKGDKVRIKNGPFSGNEGDVKSITTPKDPTETPKVTVVVTLWGRPVDVDMDYWEVDKV